MLKIEFKKGFELFTSSHKHLESGLTEIASEKTSDARNSIGSLGVRDFFWVGFMCSI